MGQFVTIGSRVAQIVFTKPDEQGEPQDMTIEFKGLPIIACGVFPKFDPVATASGAVCHDSSRVAQIVFTKPDEQGESQDMTIEFKGLPIIACGVFPKFHPVATAPRF